MITFMHNMLHLHKYQYCLVVMGYGPLQSHLTYSESIVIVINTDVIIIN